MSKKLITKSVAEACGDFRKAVLAFILLVAEETNLIKALDWFAKKMEAKP